MLWPIDSGSGWRNVEDVGLFTDDDDEKDMAMNERTNGSHQNYQEPIGRARMAHHAI